jgi:uncharacterized protein YbjT (DUF2867 family)
MDINNIAVIGATGLLGQPVTRRLIEAGFHVRILARDPERAAELFPNTEVKQADVFDQDSLERGLSDQDAVYLNLSTRQDESPDDPHTETDGMKNILAAADKSGVKRVLFISSLVQRYQGMNGFHWWAFDVKQTAVELVKQSGIHYTIFYPSTFMESYYGGYLQGEKLMLVGESRQPMYFIAGDDYGNQVVESIRIADDQNYEYVVQGPEAYTLEEAADIFQENYPHGELKKSRIPMWLLKTLSLFKQEFKYGAKILEALNNYPEEFEAKETWEQLGKPGITLTEFARHFPKQKETDT